MRPISISVRGGGPLATRAWATQNTAERVQGWLKKDGVKNGEGLLMSPASAIHMMGMKFSIDVVFLDLDYKVLKVYSQLKPGKFAFSTWYAVLMPWRSQVLELPDGAAAHLKPGDILDVSERSA